MVYFSFIAAASSERGDQPPRLGRGRDLDDALRLRRDSVDGDMRHEQGEDRRENCDADPVVVRRGRRRSSAALQNGGSRRGAGAAGEAGSSRGAGRGRARASMSPAPITSGAGNRVRGRICAEIQHRQDQSPAGISREPAARAAGYRAWRPRERMVLRPSLTPPTMPNRRRLRQGWAVDMVTAGSFSHAHRHALVRHDHLDVRALHRGDEGVRRLVR